MNVFAEKHEHQWKEGTCETCGTVASKVSDATAEKLRRAAGKIATWTDKRDALIVQARHEGGTLREIGEMVGFTHAGIAKILERNDPERSDDSTR